MSETVPIKEHNHLFVLYDADGFLVGKANPGKKVMLADAFYVPERTCRMVDCSTNDTCVVNRELCNGDVMSMEFGYKRCSECGVYVFDCPTVRYCPSCDRDALLRLARYMDKDVAETEAHFSNVISTKSVSDYARRIREACGEGER